MVVSALSLSLLAACSGSDRPAATSGPPSSIVHLGPTGAQLYAVRHKLSLADLPLRQFVGLPGVGTIEVGANLLVPLGGDGINVRGTDGTIAVRCVGPCQLGDDRTSLPDRGLGPITISHLDLSGFEAHIEAKGGVVRLTRFALASADLELALSLEVRLAPDPRASQVDACVRFRPTAALRERDPRLHALISLGAPAGDDGWQRVRITGTVAAPRRQGTSCEPTTPP